MDIFNPTLCLSKQLNNSWSKNLITELDPDKIPIEIVEGIPRLKMVHDTHSRDDWFACAIPLRSSWEPVDISEFNTLSLVLYSEGNEGGFIRFEDSSGTESKDFHIDDFHNGGSEEASASIDLNRLKDQELDSTAIKLLKIIGYKGAAFYVSEVFLK